MSDYKLTSVKRIGFGKIKKKEKKKKNKKKKKLDYRHSMRGYNSIRKMQSFTVKSENSLDPLVFENKQTEVKIKRNNTFSNYQSFKANKTTTASFGLMKGSAQSNFAKRKKFEFRSTSTTDFKPLLKNFKTEEKKLGENSKIFNVEKFVTFESETEKERKNQNLKKEKNCENNSGSFRSKLSGLSASKGKRKKKFLMNLFDKEIKERTDLETLTSLNKKTQELYNQKIDLIYNEKKGIKNQMKNDILVFFYF